MGTTFSALHGPGHCSFLSFQVVLSPRPRVISPQEAVTAKNSVEYSRTLHRSPGLSLLSGSLFFELCLPLGPRATSFFFLPPGPLTLTQPENPLGGESGQPGGPSHLFLVLQCLIPRLSKTVAIFLNKYFTCSSGFFCCCYFRQEGESAPCFSILARIGNAYVAIFLKT